MTASLLVWGVLMFSSLWRKQPARRHCCPHPQRSFRLAVERLEDRIALSHLPIEAEFQVNNTPFKSLNAPQVAIASDMDGDFVVAWAEGDPKAQFTVLARRFDRNGVPKDPADIVVDPGTFAPTATGLVTVDVTMARDGGFVVVWDGHRNLAGDSDISAKYYDAAGNLVQQIAQVDKSVQRLESFQPSAALNDAGTVYIAYNAQDATNIHVFIQQLPVAGGAAQPIDAFSQDANAGLPPPSRPSIAADGAGDFAAAWNVPGRGTLPAVFNISVEKVVVLERFPALNGPPQLILLETTGAPPSVGMAHDTGNVVLSLSDPAQQAVLVRQFDPFGILGPAIQVNATPVPDIALTSVAVDDDGDFVVTWDTATTPLFARVFNADGSPESAEIAVSGNNLLPVDVAVDSTLHQFETAWGGRDAVAGQSQTTARIYRQLLTKTFADNTVTAGTTGHTFTILVTNNSLADAANVMVMDTVDGGLTVTDIRDNFGNVYAASNNISLILNQPLPSMADWTITVTYGVPSTTDTGLIPNAAAVRFEKDQASDFDSVLVAEDVRLNVVKDFADNSVVAGTAGHTFTIAVTNNGISDADNVTAIDTVDGGLTVTDIRDNFGNVYAASNAISLILNQSLATMATWTITVTYRVPSTTDTGTINNTAIADSEEVAPVQDGDSVDVTEDVQLSVVKVFADNTVTAGTAGHTFTIAVTNSGASDADSVTVMDTVDGSLRVTAIRDNFGNVYAASNAISLALNESLAAGAAWTITVTYRVPAATGTGTIDNTVVADSEEVASVQNGDSVRVAKVVLPPVLPVPPVPAPGIDPAPFIGQTGVNPVVYIPDMTMAFLPETPAAPPIAVSFQLLPLDIQIMFRTGSARDVRVGEISGRVFLDLNGNGIQDEGEPGIAGVRVFLDMNDNGIQDENEPAINTDPQGRYLFTGLALSRHRVRRLARSPRVVQTSPERNTPHVVELSWENSSIPGKDFGTKVLPATMPAGGAPGGTAEEPPRE